MSIDTPNHLNGKAIIITGAGSGFGRLVAVRVAQLGAHVALADVNEAGLQETANLLAGPDGQPVPESRLLTLVTDVTDRAQVQALAAETVSRFDRIDIMLNNAGVMPLAFHADHDIAHDAWDRCIDINFKGVLNGISAVHDQMISQGAGHVVNVSSIYGNFPVAGAGVYGATKAAVNFLSESLRIESQGKIKVTTIKPTGVPATGLSAGVVNPAAIVGILGQNVESYGGRFEAWAAGQLPATNLDPESIEYFALAPDLLAEQIVHAMNQPWGIAISEITVRASGDGYIL